MPVSDNTSRMLIVAGCAGVGVATLVLIKYLQRHSDLQVLRVELESLRRDLEEVRGELRSLTVREVSLPPISEGENLETGCSDESEGEFFDANEGSAATAVLGLKSAGDQDVSLRNSLLDLSAVLKRADSLYALGKVEEREQAYSFLKETLQSNSRGRQHYDLLWRCARAGFLYAQTFLNKDEAKRKLLVFEAKEWAFGALKLKEDDPDVHKWCALTLGTSTDFLGMNEKIQKGYDFKKHIDRALGLRENDPILHHLCGRWCFEVANLSWIERKVASALFSEPPSSSHDEALQSFLQAEKLQPDSWPENLLYIAKAYLAKGETELAIPFIRKTLSVPATGPDDVVAQDEAKYLITKY